MVSIFTGLGAGFERGSGSALGAAGLLGGGSIGRNNEQVSLNAATGNLLITQRDEFLVGRGPDSAISRTYNSLGDLSDDNGDNWRQSTDRRVYGLTGTLNAAGSTVQRVSGDGSDITYTYRSINNVAAYWTTDGAGAHDKLTGNGSSWTWTDGDSQYTETYAAYGSNTWRIASVADTSGNALTFSYTGANLTRVTTANGEYEQYDWAGGNISQIVTGYTDLDTNTPKTLTRTRYGYDALSRLIMVEVDLSPNDNSISDNAVYRTTYSYQGNSHLVSSIAQTDGSLLEIGYDGQQRVTSLRTYVDATTSRLTQISYGSGTTSVTDALGQVTTLAFDARGQLTRLASPAPASNQPQIGTNFVYNVDGDLVRSKDGAGAVTTYEYDERGNLAHIGRPMGDDTWRTYDTANRLVVARRNASDEASAGEAQSTRFTYDQYDNLRFTIAADGTVTENVLGWYNRVDQVRTYRNNRYDLTGLDPDIAIDNAAMESWAGSGDRTSSIVQFTYDDRLNVTQTYRYSNSDQLGNAIWWEDNTHELYSYDQAGRLLGHYTSSAYGRAPAGDRYAYDGMGRLTASTDAVGATTCIFFEDAAMQTVITLASGLVTASTFNRAGDLISLQKGGALQTGGTATYQYDQLGRARATTDANGHTAYAIYDSTGRKIADVDQDGALVEYRYNAADRLVGTVRYTARLGAAQLAIAADANQHPDISQLRPADDLQDIFAWNVYDQGGRLIETIAGDGSAIRMEYDAGDRLIRTTRFATRLSAATINGFITGAPTAATWPATDIDDEVTRSFYDRLGRLVGTLDGEGYLTRIVYDSSGNVVQTSAFHNRADSSLRAAGTLGQLVASVGTHSNDAVTRRVYDGQNFLRFEIDGLGQVTEYGYRYQTSTIDFNETANGPVREVTRYAGSIGALGSYTVDSVRQALSAAGLTTNSVNRTNYSVYDAAGRLNYAIDAEGAVVRYAYDASGNLICETAYADLRVTTFLPAPWEMDSWAGSVVANTANRVTRYYYDARDSLRFTVDAEGYVTGADYDAAGQRTSSTIWSGVVAATDSWTTGTVAAASKGTASTTSYVYDAEGRVVRTVDAAGSRVDTIYRGNGTVQDTIASQGTSEESRTRFDYDGSGRLIRQVDAAGTTYEAQTLYGYDGAGNLISTTDADNQTTTRAYDRAGRMTSETDALLNTTGYDYDALGNAVRIVDARGNASWSYYDKLGRVVAVRDAEDYVTETTYTAFGEVASVTVRANRASNPANFETLPAVAAGGNDATTQFRYDRVGHSITTIDAEGYAEQRWYDAFGAVVQTINKLGGVTRDVYDRRGLLVAETRPIGTSDEWGNQQVRGTSAVDFDYYYYGTANADLSGMLWSPSWLEQHWRGHGRYEGRDPNAFFDTTYYLAANPEVAAAGLDPLDHYRTSGLREGRRPSAAAGTADPPLTGGVVIRYEYDAQGRRTKMIEASGRPEQRTTAYGYDAVGRLATRVGDVVRVEDTSDYLGFTTQAPTDNYTYDSRGNLVETIDPIGARTLFWYDKLDRKIAELGATGTLTQYQYDQVGNLTRMTVWGSPLALPANPGGEPPVAPGGANRVTDYVYDAADRLTSTTIENVRSGAWNGTAYALTATTTGVTTSYDYDAAGNVVRTTDGAGSATYAYYDRIGRKFKQVDGEGYMTAWLFDAEGNVTHERRWAEKAPQYSLAGYADPPITTGDRTTDMVYDRMGRRMAEYRTVEAWAVDAVGNLSADNGTSAVYYSYNGLGEVVSKTETTGDQTFYEYDHAGRLTAEVRAGFVDSEGNAVSPLLRYHYDGLGDVVRTSQSAAAGGPERVTRYEYGPGGRLAATFNANGDATQYFYDAAGNTLRQNYLRRDADWNQSYEGLLFRRDLLGRVIEQAVARYNGTTWDKGDLQQTEYNAFGEIARSGVNGRWQQQFIYDAAGRVIKSNGGDGAWRLHVHDGAGRETLTIESNQFIDLATTSLDDVVADINHYSVAPLGQNRPYDLNLSFLIYDKRGQQTATWQPFRSLGAQQEADLWTHRTYNAFGEVTGQSDALDHWTYFRYNAMGRAVKTTHPEISVMGTDGTVTTVAPIERIYYDRAGRLIATADMNGHVTTRQLLAGTGYGGSEALVTAEFHADGGVKRQKFSVFGDVRASIDEIGRTTWMSYDNLSRLVQVASPIGHTDAYEYDQLGQQIRHTIGELPYWDAEKTYYDAQGRVTTQIAFGYTQTNTSYAWNDAAVTQGLGAYGGWTQTTTYANGRTSVQQSDLFGHVQMATDLGGHQTTYAYDRAGRVSDTYGPEHVRYNWLGNGKLESVFNTLGGVNFTKGTTYSYDAAGRQLTEASDEGNLYYQHGRAVYDALGRMTDWYEDGNGSSSQLASKHWDYDKAGNIVHTQESSPTLDAQGTPSATPRTSSRWFAFDVMNRVVTDGGMLASGGVVRGSGTSYLYDAAGQRMSATRSASLTGLAWQHEGVGLYLPTVEPREEDGWHQVEVTYAGEREERYEYDGAGALRAVTILQEGYRDNSNGTVSATGTIDVVAGSSVFEHDTRGRLTRQTDVKDGQTVYDHTLSYDWRGLMSDETTATRQGSDTLYATSRYEYGYGADYALGAAIKVDSTSRTNAGATQYTSTYNDYAWWGGAQLAQVRAYGPVASTTTYGYDTGGHLTSVAIADARARTVTFVNDALGQALRRDEADALASGDPHERWYRFGGVEIGHAGNNAGAPDEYLASIAQRGRVASSAPFGNVDPRYRDRFSQAVDTIDSWSAGEGAGRYTVRGGDTLAGIALQLWGDAALWYKLASANGLSASSTLVAGQSLTVPAGIVRSTYNAATLTPYDPARALGDVSPLAPAAAAGSAAARRNNSCGVFGAILLVVVAVAVTVVTSGAAAAAIASAATQTSVGLGAGIGLAFGGTLTSGVGLSAIGLATVGAIGGAVGSVVSQGFGVASGLQDKFSWKGVALAGLAGGIGGGLGRALPGGGALAAAGRGALGNALTQGIGVATGLQSKFDFAGVAAAGIGAGVGAWAGGKVFNAGPLTDRSLGNIAANLGTGAAAGLANAAARSLLNGTDFGDNVMAALPDVIGNTIGGLVADQVANGGIRKANRLVSNFDGLADANSYQKGIAALALQQAAKGRGVSLSEAASDPALQATLSAVAQGDADKTVNFLKRELHYSDDRIAQEQANVNYSLAQGAKFLGFAPDQQLDGDIVVDYGLTVAKVLGGAGHFFANNAENPYLNGGLFLLNVAVAPVSTLVLKGVEYTPGLGDAYSAVTGWLGDKAIDYGGRIAQHAGVSSADAPYVAGGAFGVVGLAALGASALKFVAPVISRFGAAGRGVIAAERTVLGEANFAQKSFKATFSEEGAFAGRRVSDVAGDIRAGRISPSDVPLDYIVREGKPIILNTRSAQALEQAGVPRGQWNGVNRTGDSFFEELLSGQLSRNKLGPQGTPTVRPGSGRH